MGECFSRKKRQRQYEMKNYFNLRIAIIDLKLGDTKNNALIRHVSKYPGDTYANIKIFNLDNKG